MRVNASASPECSCSGAGYAPCDRGLTAYREAVTHGSTRREDTPECLLRLGLVTPSPDDPAALVPVAPGVALSGLLRPAEEIIETQRTRVQEISSGFSAVNGIHRAAGRETQKWLTLIDGEQAVSIMLREAVRGCRSELLALQPSGPLGDHPRYLSGCPYTPPEGITYRALYPHSARNNPMGQRRIAAVGAAGGEARTVDQITQQLIIRDRATAYLAHSRGPGHQALVEIRHPVPVAFLTGVFEDRWARARPTGGRAAGSHEAAVATETRQAVMRLLVSGNTDDAIARRLGVSRRTVATHVAAISEVLGARSRAELGYLIATTGALRDDDRTV